MAVNLKTLFSVGPGVFTEEDFARAVRDIASPDLEGWEFLVESMGTKIYRKYKEVSWADVQWFSALEQAMQPNVCCTALSLRSRDPLGSASSSYIA